jgi:hypothetical protein
VPVAAAAPAEAAAGETGRCLRVLRRAGPRTQRRAAADGWLPVSCLADVEGGRRALPPERLRSLVEAWGYPAAALGMVRLLVRVGEAAAPRVATDGSARELGPAAPAGDRPPTEPTAAVGLVVLGERDPGAMTAGVS